MRLPVAFGIDARSWRPRAILSRFSQALCGFALFTSVLLAGCSSNHAALNVAGPQAGRIAFLWWLFFWVTTIAYLLVIAALVYGLVRRRRVALERSDAQLAETDRKSTRVIGGAVALTVVLLLVLAISDFVVGRAIEHRPPDPLRIKIVAHQWWWEIEYDDPVPSSRIRTANELHIPTGRPVELTLSSTDVIHSFWIPNLHGKRDLIPGRTTTTLLSADKPGWYEGQCAEFCGHQHARMRLLLQAHTPEDFSAWQDRQRQPAKNPATPEQAHGQQVFLSSTCIMCHSISGTPASGTVAPDLSHLASRRMLAAGTLPNTKGHLGGWISDPQRVKPGSYMPSTALPSQDLNALLAYLTSLE